MINTIKELASILKTKTKMDFFTIKGDLKKQGIKSDYSQYQYLIINYRKNKFCLTSTENAEPEKEDIIINNKFVLGIN